MSAATCPTPDKIKHPDHASAMKHMRALLGKGGSIDLMPYRCGNHWHVGHSAISLSKRIRRALRRTT